MLLGFPWVSRYLVLNCVDTKYLPKFHLGLQKNCVFSNKKYSVYLYIYIYIINPNKFPFDSSEHMK